jgi:hypothetical protein
MLGCKSQVGTPILVLAVHVPAARGGVRCSQRGLRAKPCHNCAVNIPIPCAAAPTGVKGEAVAEREPAGEHSTARRSIQVHCQAPLQSLSCNTPTPHRPPPDPHDSECGRQNHVATAVGQLGAVEGIRAAVRLRLAGYMAHGAWQRTWASRASPVALARSRLSAPGLLWRLEALSPRDGQLVVALLLILVVPRLQRATRGNAIPMSHHQLRAWHQLHPRNGPHSGKVR